MKKDYFDSLYEVNLDPWNFAHSAYEDRKYKDTLQALPYDTYQNALEIGCSIGVLTERLAERCERLLAIDVSPRALAAARNRCAFHPTVKFMHSNLPAQYPHGIFDLVVLSEVGYYWSMEDLARVAGHIVSHLNSEGQVLLVHWTPIVEEYPLTGDQVHDLFVSVGSLAQVHGHRTDLYRLDLLQNLE